jgi:uncharacterized cupin superfamily protein
MDVPEAELERTPGGLKPARPGWFIVNLADTEGMRHGVAGKFAAFENFDGAQFSHFGINVHFLDPGQPNGRYHRESVQEAFLVLHGECLAIVEGQERPMRAWDFLHCPPGTDHILIGAGDGPCAILMVGDRDPDATVHYPVSELAARFGASSSQPTDESKVAYADWPKDYTPEPVDWPPR